METPTVYVETSVISYLAADPSRDPVTARNQRITHAWWARRDIDFVPLASEFVSGEARNGDPRLAQRRLARIAELTLLSVDEVVIASLARRLLEGVPLPSVAGTDALHIATAAAGGVTFLATWNCRHIANPRLWPRMDRVCREQGHVLPALRTPAQLMEDRNDGRRSDRGGGPKGP